MLQRTDKYGSECVIHDKYYSVLVSHLGNCLKVCDIAIRIKS